MMKTVDIILFLLVLTTSFPVYAQIKYSYDESGNRIKREIILEMAEDLTKSADTSEAVVINNEILATDLKNPALEETLGELEVKLYPNPTQGAVFFELNRLPESGNTEIEIWTSEGRIIGKSEIEGKITRINLLGKPNGIYFIKASLEGQPVTWKIIKR